MFARDAHCPTPGICDHYMTGGTDLTKIPDEAKVNTGAWIRKVMWGKVMWGKVMWVAESGGLSHCLQLCRGRKGCELGTEVASKKLDRPRAHFLSL